MSTRYCPSCKSKLTFSDFYFCSNCLIELPVDLQIPPPHQQRLITYEQNYFASKNGQKLAFESIKRVFHILNIKEILIILFVTVAIGAPVYYLMKNADKYLKKTETQVTAPVAETKEVKKEKPNFSTFFPYSVDMYFEDTSQSFAFFTFSKSTVVNEETIKKVYWGLAIEEPNQEGETPKSEFSQKVENVYLVADSSETLNSMINSRIKLVKNLSLNPEFVLFKSSNSEKNEIYGVFSETPIEYMKSFDYAKLPQREANYLKEFFKDKL